MTPTEGLRLRGRGQTYGLLAGVVTGMLVVGLAIPYVFGVPLNNATPHVTQLAPGAEDADLSDDPEAAQPFDEGDEGDAEISEDPGEALVDEDAGSAGDPRPEPAPAGPAATSPTDGSQSGDQDQGAEAPAAPAAASGSRAELTASDRGVTPERIRIGFLLLDTGGVGRVGIGVPGIDPAEQQEAWQAYVDGINERGGINGRLIEPIYESYDVIDPEDMQRACLALTQDARVFAAVDSGGFFGAPVLCFTEQNETPLVLSGSSGITDELFARSGGRLYTTFMRGNRVMANLANELHNLEALHGKTLGILTDKRPGQPETARRLEAALERLGHEVAYIAELDENIHQGASEIPIAVQQMNARGVEGVFLLGSFIYGNQFVQTADSQGYHPDYFVGDWNNASTDTFGQGMPDSYDGALAITVATTNEHRAGIAEREHATACRETYTQRTGKPLENGMNQYGTYLRGCAIVEIVEAAATRAGPNLTRARFTAALAELGEVPLADAIAGSYRQGKPDAADFVRTLRWTASCRCYMPQDDYRRARF